MIRAVRARSHARTRRREGVDITLAGQLLDGLANGLGDLAQNPRTSLLGRPAAKMQGGAEMHSHWHSVPATGPGRLYFARSDEPDGDHRSAGTQGEPGNTGAEAVEAPVRGAGALWIDAQGAAAGQDFDSDIDHGGGRAGIGAGNRHMAHAVEEGRHRPAAKARGGEVFGLGEVIHLAPGRERSEDLVGERDVIGREYHRARVWEVLEAGDLRAEHGAQQWCGGEFERPVEHTPEATGTPQRGGSACRKEIRHTGVVKFQRGAEPGTAGATPDSTRDAVARLVLEQGPQHAAALAGQLGLSAAAVRRHLDALVADGLLVECEPRRSTQRGRGRPARTYALTDAGRAVFPHAYDDLATTALRYLHNTGGEAAVVAFAEHRAHTLAATLSPDVDLSASGGERTAALATSLTSHGYAATTESATAGVQLCQHHCPVGHVAAEFPQLCEAETRAFERVLGTYVQRLATIAHGDGVCTTHVPVPPIVRKPVQLAARSGRT